MAVDAARAVLSDPATAFAIVFAAEAVAFLAAAVLAARVGRSDADEMKLPAIPTGEPLHAE